MNLTLFENEHEPLVLIPLQDSLDNLQAQQDQLLVSEAELTREIEEAQFSRSFSKLSYDFEGNCL